MLDQAKPRRADQAALDLIFMQARTHYSWSDRPVSDETLEEVYKIARMAPTSSNCNPVRMIFVKSPEAKERLRHCLAPGNVEKAMTAPVTAIFGYDLDFFNHLDRLAPFSPDMYKLFSGDPALAQRASFRNSTLQGAYMILAARAVGLDCGPMSGFSHDAVDAGFWPGGRVKSNFLLNLGYGVPEKLFPRQFRFPFHEICEII